MLKRKMLDKLRANFEHDYAHWNLTKVKMLDNRNVLYNNAEVEKLWRYYFYNHMLDMMVD